MGEGSQRHAMDTLPPGKRPCTHCTGSWVGPRADMNRCGKSRPTSISAMASRPTCPPWHHQTCKLKWLQDQSDVIVNSDWTNIPSITNPFPQVTYYVKHNGVSLSVTFFFSSFALLFFLLRIAGRCVFCEVCTMWSPLESVMATEEVNFKQWTKNSQFSSQSIIIASVHRDTLRTSLPLRHNKHVTERNS
jgi:hypothetical protein